MIVTPYKVYTLPEPYVSRLKYKVIQKSHDVDGDVLEVIAHLSGQPAHQQSVKRWLDEVELKELDDVVVTEPSDLVTIECGSDYNTFESRALLRRRFHSFDEYFAKNPTADVVSCCLHVNTLTSVFMMDGVVVSDLDYLRPKDIDEYFLMCAPSMSDERLLSLIDQLTPDDVEDMLAARTHYHRHPLPNSGQDRPILAHILEVIGDWERLARFFPDYPSYLALSDTDDEEALVRFLTTMDFSKSNERLIRPIGVADQLSNLLLYTTTKEEARVILAMVGTRDKLFGNEDLEVVLPYRLPIERVCHLSSDIRRHLSNLFEVTIGDVSNINDRPTTSAITMASGINMSDVESMAEVFGRQMERWDHDIETLAEESKNDTPINLDEIDFDD